MIDLCSDSEESCTVQDVRPENDSNPSRKKQKRIEKKHQNDLQGGIQSRLSAGYVNSGSGPIPFLRTINRRLYKQAIINRQLSVYTLYNTEQAIACLQFKPIHKNVIFVNRQPPETKKYGMIRPTVE